MYNRHSIIVLLKEYFIITFGLLLYTLGWDTFLIPNGLVGGGVTGISAILLYAFKIPLSVTFFVINAILLVIGLKILGKGFGAKTIYAIIVASVFLDVVPEFLSEDFIREFATSNGKLLCALCGGIMAGLGIGICFSQGGSTGGTDIVALIISKLRNIAPGRIILTIDIFIVASALLLPAKEIVDAAGNVTGVQPFGEKLAIVLYGYILVFTTGYVIDLFISGTKQSLQIFIISEKYDEIADLVITDLKRGVTLLDSEGWYTKKKGKILMVMIRKHDISLLYRIIKSVDKNAFISVSSVSGVYGNGFDAMKK